MVSAMGPSGDQRQDRVAVGVGEIDELDAHSRRRTSSPVSRATRTTWPRACTCCPSGSANVELQLLADLEQQIGADEGAADRQVLRVELDVAVDPVGRVGDGDRELERRASMLAEVAGAPLRRAPSVCVTERPGAARRRAARG